MRGGLESAAPLLLLIGLFALALWLRFGPIDAHLLDRSRFSSVTVFDRHGEVLYEPLGSSGNRNEWVSDDRLPKHVVDATLAAEDQRFFSHVGIDPLAVARAIAHDLRARRFAEGGSTITQQVAKLLLVNRDRGLTSKVREAVLALRLEHRLSKRKILALYLNLAPYGNQISGIARASRAYFGCEPSSLTAAQAAYLASLPQRPSAFNPLRDPARVVPRQRLVLARMRDAGSLSADEERRARGERLRFNTSTQPVIAMHFVEELLARTPPRDRIITTLDAGLQREVSGIIAAHRSDLVRHGAHAAAVVVLDNANGEWLAWEGSGDYFGLSFGGAIDGVTTPRQPGSALKPFTYAVGFETGTTPATVLADVPSNFPTAQPGVVYTPRNYDGAYRGPLRARAALAGSENVPAVEMLARVGPEALLRLLRNLGFSTLNRTADYYGLGLTLGDAEVTLEQLVTAYATFAREGVQVTPVMVRGASPRARRALSQRTAFWITDILSDADARAYVFGDSSSLDLPFPVAVKTGTSQAYRDNWTVGYTRDVTVGVWVGNFDRQELRGSSGVTGAAPVFNAVMLAAMKRARGAIPVDDPEPVIAATADVEQVEICALSGLRPSPYCPAIRKEWLPKNAAAQFCAWHHDGAIEWPAEYRGWARANSPVLTASSHVSAARTTRLRISNPADGATYLIDPTLRMQYQTLRLRAHTDTKVAWRIDDRPVGTAAADADLEWPLVPGPHTIRATDTTGAADSVRIYVK